MSTPQDFDDPHRHERRVHYRLYAGRDGKPIVICVQDFDYYDYDATRFLSPDAWFSEQEAQAALEELIPPAWSDFAPDQVLVVVLDEGNAVYGWHRNDEQTLRLMDQVLRGGRRWGGPGW